MNHRGSAHTGPTDGLQPAGWAVTAVAVGALQHAQQEVHHAGACMARTAAGPVLRSTRCDTVQLAW